MNAPAGTARLQVGGTLVPDRDLYIPRPEDEELSQLLREREYVNAVSPRNSLPANVPMVVFLASDAAANVTGQVLRTDDTQLSLYSHPKPTRQVINVAGWTVESVCEVFPSTIGMMLEPVGLAATTYGYYDGITAGPPPVLGNRGSYLRWTIDDTRPKKAHSA